MLFLHFNPEENEKLAKNTKKRKLYEIVYVGKKRKKSIKFCCCFDVEGVDL